MGISLVASTGGIGLPRLRRDWSLDLKVPPAISFTGFLWRVPFPYEKVVNHASIHRDHRGNQVSRGRR